MGRKSSGRKATHSYQKGRFSSHGIELCNHAGRLSLYLLDVYCLLFALMYERGLTLAVVIFSLLSEVFSWSFAGT